MSKKITIDGFNGTGKTTLAKALAKKLGFTYISTGIIFRSLSYCLIKDEIDRKLIEANCIPPTDAIVIDTTKLKQEEVLEKVMKLCRDKKLYREEYREM